MYGIKFPGIWWSQIQYRLQSGTWLEPAGAGGLSSHIVTFTVMYWNLWLFGCCPMVVPKSELLSDKACILISVSKEQQCCYCCEWKGGRIFVRTDWKPCLSLLATHTRTHTTSYALTHAHAVASFVTRCLGALLPTYLRLTTPAFYEWIMMNKRSL